MGKPGIKVLELKLRRVAAGLRQRDCAGKAGMTTTRLSAIERGDIEPNDEDIRLLEIVLPPLPPELLSDSHSPETVGAGP